METDSEVGIVAVEVVVSEVLVLATVLVEKEVVEQDANWMLKFMISSNYFPSDPSEVPCPNL